MARPRLANPGKTVALYLRGEHLRTLAGIRPRPADAIRTLIEQRAASEPSRPEQEIATPTLCERCSRVACPCCPTCRVAFGLAPPRADPVQALCERCQRVGLPNCRECIHRAMS
jgi:hypothetical protein